ncbi:hypothetical protein EYR36_003030 [Pleurotus pulmonarius]|nr:hypothetical protein EYR36_003030 [Pleurotus pulmonarius]
MSRLHKTIKHPSSPPTYSYLPYQTLPSLWYLIYHCVMHLSLPKSAFILFSVVPLAWAAPACSLVPPPKASAVSHASTVNNVPEEVLATAWYPGWLGDKFPPSKISWDKFNAMTFAFALVPSLLIIVEFCQKTLPEMVSAARAQGVSPSLSIGGWTGSIYFSSAVATPQNRSAFVKAVVGLANTYQLDGIDFDWEYPNKQGIGCNIISPDDSANFLSFLQELRKDPVGSNLTISAAVGLTPFMGPTAPMTDVSPFAEVLDHIAIMAYDIWGSWSNTVGPNAPLDDSCAPTQAGSATSAVNAWTAAGFPASKIALGIAAYGHSFHVQSNAALDGSGGIQTSSAFDKGQQPKGDSWDTADGTTVDQCGNPEATSGVFNFWGLVEGGFLNNNGTAASGIDYRFDNCSQTPFVYNPATQVMVSYDDATSFAAKGKFINDQGLKGFALWNAAGDFDDVLLASISDAMGIETEC